MTCIKKTWRSALQKALNCAENKENLDTRNVIFSTCARGQPYSRYVVFRGFMGDDSNSAGAQNRDTGSGESGSDAKRSDLKEELLLFTTDIRMEKVKQMEESSQAKTQGAPSELVFWMTGSSDQFRLRGLSYVYHPSRSMSSRFNGVLTETLLETERKSQFEKLSRHLRASFLRPEPGTDLAEAGNPEKWEKALDSFEDAGKNNAEGDNSKQLAAYENFAIVLFEPIEVDHLNLKSDPNERKRWYLHENCWISKDVCP